MTKPSCLPVSYIARRAFFLLFLPSLLAFFSFSASAPESRTGVCSSSSQAEISRRYFNANETPTDICGTIAMLIETIQGLNLKGEVEKALIVNTMARVEDHLSLELFPNPAGSEVNIQLSGLEHNGVVTIYNQMGSAVWQQPVGTGAVSLKVPLVDNAFVPGVYTVSLRVENEVITRRLVVVR